jgi:hypothetical protein
LTEGKWPCVRRMERMLAMLRKCQMACSETVSLDNVNRCDLTKIASKDNTKRDKFQRKTVF